MLPKSARSHRAGTSAVQILFPECTEVTDEEKEQFMKRICKDLLTPNQLVAGNLALTSIEMTDMSDACQAFPVNFFQAAVDFGLIVLCEEIPEKHPRFGVLASRADEREYPAGSYALLSPSSLLGGENSSITSIGSERINFWDGRRRCCISTSSLLSCDQLGETEEVEPAEFALKNQWQQVLHEEIRKAADEYFHEYFPAPKSAYNILILEEPAAVQSAKVHFAIACDGKNPLLSYAGSYRSEWTCVVPVGKLAGEIQINGSIISSVGSSADNAVSFKQSKKCRPVIKCADLKVDSQSTLASPEVARLFASKFIRAVRDEETAAITAVVKQLESWGSGPFAEIRVCRRFATVSKKFKQRLVMATIGADIQDALQLRRADQADTVYEGLTGE